MIDIRVSKTEFNVKFGVVKVCMGLGALYFEITSKASNLFNCLSPSRHEKAPIKTVTESEISH